jgi:hypothetical protein
MQAMRKLIVLTIAALVAAATLGCHCDAPYRRGALFPPMQAMQPVQPAPMAYGAAGCEPGMPYQPSCNACAPAGAAMMDAPVLTTPGAEVIPGPTN